jgi:hypothetical protein
MTPAAIVSKLWNYCNVLRDDGMSYGDYVEQLTYLLFLKMAGPANVPYSWDCGMSDCYCPAIRDVVGAPRAHEAAVQSAERRACEVQLAHATQEGRRRSVRPLPPHARKPGQSPATLLLTVLLTVLGCIKPPWQLPYRRRLYW